MAGKCPPQLPLVWHPAAGMAESVLA